MRAYLVQHQSQNQLHTKRRWAQVTRLHLKGRISNINYKWMLQQMWSTGKNKCKISLSLKVDKGACNHYRSLRGKVSLRYYNPSPLSSSGGAALTTVFGFCTHISSLLYMHARIQSISNTPCPLLGSVGRWSWIHHSPSATSKGPRYGTYEICNICWWHSSNMTAPTL